MEKGNKQALVKQNSLRKFIAKCEYVIDCETVSHVSLLWRGFQKSLKKFLER